MSSAFVKEGASGQLKDVAPSPGALLFYLRMDYGGAVIRGLKKYYSEIYGRDIYEMRNGLTYALTDEQHCYIIPD